MIRKVTALALLLLFGLYLPAGAAPLCLCIGHDALAEERCCEDSDSCCTDQANDADACCGDPECCLLVTGLREGMEPQTTQLPEPLSAPLPVVTFDALAIDPLPAVQTLPGLTEIPPPPGDPVRIAFGVWRL